MIALLSCSTSWSRTNNSNTSSTGGLDSTEVRTDSVLIAYDDLRLANAKFTELKYEKEINNNLRNIIVNDSIAIDNLNSKIRNMEVDCKKRIEKVKKERNIAGGIGIGTIALLIISIL